MVGIV